MLSTQFQFVFVDGPFPSEAGPGVSPFFDGMEPFWRWQRSHPYERDSHLREVVERALKGEGPGVVQGVAVKSAPSGPVVGILGFSQGSQVVAGLLIEQQRRNQSGEEGWGIQFGILAMSGPSPLLLSEGPTDAPDGTDAAVDESLRGAVSIPTLHIVGLQDPYLENGRLLYQYFNPETAILHEYDVGHRLPTAQADNDAVAAAIMDLYRKTSQTPVSRATTG